jgi:hypothetical protein
VLAFAGIFIFVREPVILVSDASFRMLYGEKRFFIDKWITALRIFRPVKTVIVAEGAGPDLVALAAKTAAKNPRAVFFSYRHYDGALRYVRDYPDMPAAVLAGRKKPPGGGEKPFPLWITADIGTNIYRAGLCAAATVYVPGEITPSGGIVMYHDGDFAGEREKRAFRQGIDDFWKGITGAAYRGKLDYVNSRNYMDPPAMPENEQFLSLNWETTACVVIEDHGGGFFRANAQEIPLIVFTWMDPAFLPGETVMVFDDSPWAILPQALALVESGRNGFIPSKLRFPAGGLSKDLEKRLKTAYLFEENGG